MDYYIKLFIHVCMLTATLGSTVWIIYLLAYALMSIFPYAQAAAVGSVGVMCVIAGRRSRGH